MFNILKTNHPLNSLQTDNGTEIYKPFQDLMKKKTVFNITVHTAVQNAG